MEAKELAASKNRNTKIMNAQELRLGNWVSISPMYHKEDVRDIDLKMINAIQNGFEVFGIPLSSEILKRCEFVEDEVFERYFIYLNKHKYDIDKLSFRSNEGFICFDGIRYRTILKHVTCLHQLQNLFYSITGEELTINF